MNGTTLKFSDLRVLYRLPFIRFLAVGLSNLFVAYSVFLLALIFVHYQWALGASIISSMIYTGLLNIHHTFIRKVSILRVSIYSLYYLGYAFANLFCVTALVENYDVSPKLAVLLLPIVMVPLHYFFSKILIEHIAPLR